MLRYITLFLFLCIGGNADTQVLIDSVIAVVNTDAITHSELENEFRIAAIMGKPIAETPTAAEKRGVLETIINRKFVLQESDQIGVVVAERDAQIAEQIAEIRARYTSETNFQNAMEQYQLETETLKMWVYEQLIYGEFFRRKFFNAVNSAEVERLTKSYYEKNKEEFVVPPTVTFYSLLIVVPDATSETEKQNTTDLTQKLSERLQNGETFETVRKAYETQLALQFKVLTLETNTPLGTVVTELQTFERSKPLVVEEGYQIVERIRNNPPRQKTYSEVSEAIAERVRQEQAEKQFEAWLNGQKEDGIWHILDDTLTRSENEVK
jgi:parvulin-like peptidyl-prolyl isomerase